MVLHFNANKDTIGKMVASIEKQTRSNAEWKSGCAIIGDYKLTDDGALIFDENLGGDPDAFYHSALVIDECIMACGECPAEFAEYAELIS